MVAESWFRNLWKFPKRHESGSEKVVIGMLAFEAASLMSKLVHSWRSLNDKSITKLREEITKSVGIQKLVSEDEDFIVSLVCEEVMENLENIAKSVTRFAKKCEDPSLKSFENCFSDMKNKGVDPYGWELGSKKMDKKMKRMERFISANARLYQEMEILTDLEQTLKRMMCSEAGVDNLKEHQKNASWKQHEVKILREMSLWNRTYDYIVLLLARSIFTIFRRIKHVFGITFTAETIDLSSAESDFIGRSHSVSTFSQGLLHQREPSGLPRFASGPLGRFKTPASDPLTTRSTKISDFLSGPISSSPKSQSFVPEKNKRFKFYSGPLRKITGKSGSVLGMGKNSKKMGGIPEKWSISSGKKHHSKTNKLTQVGPLKGCKVAQDGSRNSSGERQCGIADNKPAYLDVPDTLGAACLALHYANVIIVIERFVASPHLIGNDARDDLYSMLPASVRACLRERLKPYAKSLTTSAVYDPMLEKEWTDAMLGILEWLAPLAHNMIKWQSERSYENQTLVSRTNIVLVLTLFFANQRKTEAAITELLVGLNYVWRFSRALNAIQECTDSRAVKKCLDTGDN